MRFWVCDQGSKSLPLPQNGDDSGRLPVVGILTLQISSTLAPSGALTPGRPCRPPAALANRSRNGCCSIGSLVLRQQPTSCCHLEFTSIGSLHDLCCPGAHETPQTYLPQPTRFWETTGMMRCERHAHDSCDTHIHVLTAAARVHVHSA